MLNLNYSSAELKALEEAAGHPVIMIPPRELIDKAEGLFLLRDSVRKKITALRPELGKTGTINFVADLIRNGNSPLLDPELRAVLGGDIEKLHRLGYEIDQAETRLGPLEEQIRRAATELKKNGQTVERIAISAHSDGSNLSGETSLRLTSSGISRLRKQFTDVFENPKHVLLLGCYNMTKTNRIRWRQLFPQATLVAGFGVRAPSRFRQISANYIKETLKTAKKLDEKLASKQKVTPVDINKMFRALDSVLGTQSVIDYCGHITEGQPGSMKLSCNEQWVTFLGQAKIFQAEYLDLLNVEKNPPREEENNPLRQFYNSVQEVCPAMETDYFKKNEAARAERYRTSIRESLIRLIYWWNVQKNFSTYFSKEISSFKKSLNNLSISVPPIPLEGDTGRIEFIRWYNHLEKTLQQKKEEILREQSLQRLAPQEKLKLEWKKRDLEELERRFSIYYPLYVLEGEDSVGDEEKSGPESTLSKGGIPFHWIDAGAVLKERGAR